MEIIDCKQHSPEWYALRKKRMTASNAQAIGNAGKGLRTLIFLLMQRYYSSADPNPYGNHAMERGIELEKSAKFLYEIERQRKVEDVGFVIHDDYIGCSPDGFIVNYPGIVEIKCPEDKEYFRLLLGEPIQPKYIWQMQMQMLICEKIWCDFVAYNPNFEKEIIIRRITKEKEKFEKLEEGFVVGKKWMGEIERKIKNL